MKPNSKGSFYLSYFKNVIFPVLLLSGFAGILVGVVVTLYNLATTFLVEKSETIYHLVQENPAFIPLLFLGLILLALLVSLMLRRTPEVKGSGIPQTEGVVRGLLTFRWLRVLVNTIAISFVSIFAGLSLGAEGPSIQIGATTAQGAGELLKSHIAWRRYIITGGASAGLAVAFNAPLTGIIFALEEAHKRFTPMILLSAASAVLFGSITSTLLKSLWGGNGLAFEMGLIEAIPLKYIWMLLITGIVCGLVAVLFNFLILAIKRRLEGSKFPLWARLVIAFVLTGLVGLFLTDATGGGHGLVLKIAAMDFMWQMLLLLFVVKLLLTVISFNSGSTGGLFIPMLAIGALVGGLCGNLFMAAGMEEMYYKTIVVVSMTSFFGASVRAPITAMILIVEITGFASGFLMTGVSIFTAFFIAQLTIGKSLYDSLLDMQFQNKNKGKQKSIISFEVGVEEHSFAVDKGVRDILWPANCLVLRLFRDDFEIVPDGETIMKAGDKLLIRAETYDESETIEYIFEIVKFKSKRKKTAK